MDLASFADQEFNLKKWINEALQTGRSPQDSIENHVSMLLMKLQVLSLELNTSLEESSNQVLSNIPRAIREIERVRKEAVVLKQRLDEFETRLCQAEEGTETSLRLLSELDRVKTKMEFCCEALKEAEKLSKMTGGMEDVFSSGDFAKIADQIEDMQKSLKVLNHLPEYQQTTRNLQLLQDRLEGMLRPHLLKAFHQRQLEEARQYLGLLERIDRAQQAQEHYFGCAAVEIEQLWDTYPSSDLSFPHWTPKFYDQLLIVIDSELSWSAKVFVKRAIVSSLLSQVLGKLGSSFKSRLESLSLEELISVYQVVASFSSDASGLLSGAGYTQDQIDEATIAFFTPFFPFQKQYPTLEKTNLSKALKPYMTKEDEFAPALRQVEDSIPKLFLFLEESIERCLKFTQGSEGEGFTKALQEIIETFLKWLFTLLHRLRVKAKLDIGDSSSSSSSSASSSSSSLSTSEATETSSSTHDWGNIQGALQLLQTANVLSSRLSIFDRTLRSSLTKQKPVLFGNNFNILATGSLSTIPCLHLRFDQDKAKRLYAFLQNLEDVAVKMLPAPAQLCLSFNNAVQTFVYDIMILFIKERLANLPSMSEWSKQPDNTSFGIQLVSFSLSPQEYVTQIGDYLFTIPQSLEPFEASATAAKQSTSASPHVHSGSLPPSNSSSSLEEEEHPSIQVATDGELSSSTPTGSGGSGSGGAGGAGEEEDRGFAYQWIKSICQGAMALYLQRIMEIPSLSEHGAQQLNTDIEYLCNIMTALEVPIDATLLNIQKYLVAPPKEYSFLLRTAEGTMKRMATMVATMRGLKDL